MRYQILFSFITDVVARRQLPLSAEVTKPSVVIKADIEGAELKILPDMVVTGALQHVDNIHMEWHGESSYRRGREPQMIDKEHVSNNPNHLINSTQNKWMLQLL